MVNFKIGIYNILKRTNHAFYDHSGYYKPVGWGYAYEFSGKKIILRVNIHVGKATAVL